MSHLRKRIYIHKRPFDGLDMHFYVPEHIFTSRFLCYLPSFAFGVRAFCVHMILRFFTHQIIRKFNQHQGEAIALLQFMLSGNIMIKIRDRY